MPTVRLGLFSKDPRLSTVLSSTLGRDVVIRPANCAKAAKSLAAEAAVDVWLIDVDPASEWRGLLEDPDFNRDSQVILMTTDESRQDALPLAEQNGYDWIRKPPAVRELKRLLRKAYEAQMLKGDLEDARRQLQTQMGLDQLSGSSAKMQVVYDLIRRTAKLDASVLITGESGTGKELLAQAIHNTGSRSHRPFTAISCGAIPETLIEAELFGHEKGAFTGTVSAREGYLEKAGDGTLFLDEIGELSLNTQVKLLRVLQQREFSRLGSSRTIPLRARVIFATHRDLSSMVAKGAFRQDLFYRINVMNIHMPSLRERTEDVPMLAQTFLARYSEMYRKPIERVDPDALLLLRNYSWPGNVRELENVIQRAIIMAEDESIRISDLPNAIQDLDVAEEENDLPAGSFERLLRDYKIKLVKDALLQCNGNKTLAAQSLSISRAYLHRLLRPSTGTTPEEAGVLDGSGGQFSPLALQ
jgi:DNA-binding NtrC family response regulator